MKASTYRFSEQVDCDRFLKILALPHGERMAATWGSRGLVVFRGTQAVTLSEAAILGLCEGGHFTDIAALIGKCAERLPTSDELLAAIDPGEIAPLQRGCEPDDLTHYMQKCGELTAALTAAEARIAELHGVALGRCNAELEVRIADLEKLIAAADEEATHSARYTEGIVKHADEMETQLADAVKIAEAQSWDSGCWFVAETAAESYLQRELRRLHAALAKLEPKP